MGNGAKLGWWATVLGIVGAIVVNTLIVGMKIGTLNANQVANQRLLREISTELTRIDLRDDVLDRRLSTVEGRLENERED